MHRRQEEREASGTRTGAPRGSRADLPGRAGQPPRQHVGSGVGSGGRHGHRGEDAERRLHRCWSRPAPPARPEVRRLAVVVAAFTRPAAAVVVVAVAPVADGRGQGAAGVGWPCPCPSIRPVHRAGPGPGKPCLEAHRAQPHGAAGPLGSCGWTRGGFLRSGGWIRGPGMRNPSGAGAAPRATRAHASRLIPVRHARLQRTPDVHTRPGSGR